MLISIVLDRLNMTDGFTVIETPSRSAFRAVVFLTGEQTWTLFPIRKSCVTDSVQCQACLDNSISIMRDHYFSIPSVIINYSTEVFVSVQVLFGNV